MKVINQGHISDGVFRKVDMMSRKTSIFGEN